MKKDERQLLIREIIQHEKLSTQKDIQDRLEQRGAGVTQTTLSRDLREIGLIKVKEKGGLYYKLADEPDRTDIFRLIAQYAQVVSRAEFTLVVRTELGEAAILANAVDEILDDQILGTVAGANTLLIVCKDQEVAQTVQQTILQHSSHKSRERDQSRKGSALLLCQFRVGVSTQNGCNDIEKERYGSRKNITWHAAIPRYQKRLSGCFFALSDGGFLRTLL